MLMPTGLEKSRAVKSMKELKKQIVWEIIHFYYNIAISTMF